ncbi:hypothetical protein HRI_002685400 [Hibiscus trionum]|nr:hypothetical protein HRI_002685400 [Hibiscus trionum]
MFQYIVMGIYTPLITCCFDLYIWCAAADPADPGVFNSKKYHKILENGKYSGPKDSKFGGDSAATFHDDNDTSVGGKTVEKDAVVTDETMVCQSNHLVCYGFSLLVLLSADVPAHAKNLPSNRCMKMACFIAVCVKLR